MNRGGPGPSDDPGLATLSHFKPPGPPIVTGRRRDSAVRAWTRTSSRPRPPPTGRPPSPIPRAGWARRMTASIGVRRDEVDCESSQVSRVTASLRRLPGAGFGDGCRCLNRFGRRPRGRCGSRDGSRRDGLDLRSRDHLDLAEEIGPRKRHLVSRASRRRWTRSGPTSRAWAWQPRTRRHWPSPHRSSDGESVVDGPVADGSIGDRGRGRRDAHGVRRSTGSSPPIP